MINDYCENHSIDLKTDWDRFINTSSFMTIQWLLKLFILLLKEKMKKKPWIIPFKYYHSLYYSKYKVYILMWTEKDNIKYNVVWSIIFYTVCHFFILRQWNNYIFIKVMSTYIQFSKMSFCHGLYWTLPLTYEIDLLDVTYKRNMFFYMVIFNNFLTI